MRARGLPYNRMIPKVATGFRTRSCTKDSQTRRGAPSRQAKKTGGGTGFGSIMLCEYLPGFHFVQLGLRRNKRKQNAARRMSSDGPHRRQVYAVCANHLLRARLALIATRSPDGVPPRYLLQRANAATQLQNALPGTRLSAGVIRRPLSQSSDKVADRSSCRPSVFPLAARERR